MAMSASPPIGRRGKPIKRLRLIPADKAFALARRFQGRFVQLPAPLSPRA
jgi:hypothetical protein